MASVYYQAYLHGFRAGEVDNELANAEGNGLTSYIGDDTVPEHVFEMHLDNEYCI